jgi:predicted glycoside hydrolase/deacetylase ChbG (UPF0249 family)
MERKVIITADDWGVNEHINRGIEKAVRAGIVTAVSAMVVHEKSRKYLDDLVALKEELKGEGINFGIGLHLSITSGKPQYRLPGNKPSSLADPFKHDYFRLPKGFGFDQIKPQHLSHEIHAQLRILAQHIGGYDQIDHMNNHHGVVYFKPKLFETFVDVASDWQIPIRSPMAWLNKFDKTNRQGGNNIPNFDDLFLNPTMREGLKNGFIKKLGNMLYAGAVERMELALDRQVTFPDVLCEQLYGHYSPGVQPKIDPITYFMDQFHRDTQIQRAHKRTAEKAKEKNYDKVLQRYQNKEEDLSFELMFHLAEGYFNGAEFKGDDRRGIDIAYFPTRVRELDKLLAFDWEKYQNSMSVEYISYQNLKL